MNIFQIWNQWGVPHLLCASDKHPEEFILIEEKTPHQLFSAVAIFLIWCKIQNLLGITNKMIQNLFPQRSVRNYPNQTLKWQLQFYSPRASSPPGKLAHVCCLLRGSTDWSRGWGSAPLLVGSLMQMLGMGTVGFVLPGGSWEKTALRMDLGPSGIATIPKMGLRCRAFSNYTYSFLCNLNW